jgi:hypothetical protein
MAKAEINGLTIIFDAVRKPLNAARKHNAWDVSFGNEEENGNIGYKLTKAGNPEKVFSFVKQMMELLIQKGAGEFTMIAEGGNRIKLYIHMFKRWLPNWQVSLKGTDSEKQIFIKGAR